MCPLLWIARGRWETLRQTGRVVARRRARAFGVERSAIAGPAAHRPPRVEQLNDTPTPRRTQISNSMGSGQGNDGEPRRPYAQLGCILRGVWRFGLAQRCKGRYTGGHWLLRRPGGTEGHRTWPYAGDPWPLWNGSLHHLHEHAALEITVWGSVRGLILG